SAQAPALKAATKRCTSALFSAGDICSLPSSHPDPNKDVPTGRVWPTSDDGAALPARMLAGLLQHPEAVLVARPFEPLPGGDPREERIPDLYAPPRRTVGVAQGDPAGDPFPLGHHLLDLEPDVGVGGVEGGRLPHQEVTRPGSLRHVVDEGGRQDLVEQGR